MYKNILTATDGSGYSEGAVRESVKMSKSCNSQLHALTVVEMNPEFLAIAPAAFEKMEKEAQSSLNKIKEQASKENVECETIIREGDEPYRHIIEEADKKGAEVIVMGRRGRTGLKRLLMGSVTAKVIGHASRKVLIVPKAATINWKNIVIATDGSKHSDAASNEAINLTKHCGKTASLHAIAVTRESATEGRILISENALEEITSKAEKEKIQVNTSLVKGKSHESIYETIIGFAKDKEADIIVMGSHGRSGIDRLMMGSVAERVIGHADCAVLVVKS